MKKLTGRVAGPAFAALYGVVGQPADEVEARGHGVGSELLATLVDSAERGGLWTLQTSVFPENAASLALLRRFGFRVVGTRKRIARQHGVWRDTVLVERRIEVVT